VVLYQKVDLHHLATVTCQPPPFAFGHLLHREKGEPPVDNIREQPMVVMSSLRFLLEAAHSGFSNEGLMSPPW
jgi:hypothetical protein